MLHVLVQTITPMHPISVPNLVSGSALGYEVRLMILTLIFQ